MKRENVIISTLIIIGMVSVLLIITKTNQSQIKKVELKYEELGSEEQKFLYDNHSIIDIDKNVPELDLLKSSLQENDVFLTGETHALVVNKKLQLQFIKYLNKEAGVRNILLENSYGFGEMINNYLDTGEEEILVKLYELCLSPVVVLNNEELSFWRNVYSYNKKLDKNKKLNFVGIDLENNVFVTIAYLISMLHDGDIPKKIKDNILSLRKLEELAEKNKKWQEKNGFENMLDGNIVTEIDEVLRNLDKDMEIYNNIYKLYLGENYFSFNYSVKNRIRTIEFYDTNNQRQDKDEQYIERDQIIYDNFIALYNNLPKGKYYGQFGSAHIFQKSFVYHSKLVGSTYYSSIGEILNNPNSPVKNKVISIKYFYVDSVGYDSPAKNTVEINDLSQEGKELFSPFMKSDDVVLFRLIGGNSPFENKLIWLDNLKTKEPEGGITTDYYQYLILIKNSYPISLKSVNE